MKNSPTVDVIIPTYNGLPYLKDTISSVLKQAYTNLQLYVVDDGSTDKGATKKYVESIKDTRVHYLRKANGGQATARNYGIGISSSPYVALLDSDDLWHPDKLKRQVSMMEQSPKMGMVYGFCRVINHQGRRVAVQNVAREGDLYKYLLSGNRIWGSASMVLVRRSVFERLGVFREDFLIGEDWEMWLRIARDYEIGCVKSYLVSLLALPSGMQTGFLKMARGLDYMLPILLEEFKPGIFDRGRLYGACLWDATTYYYSGNDIDNAQRAFIRLLVHNPMKLKRNRIYWFMYIRLILRSNWLRTLRRYLSPGYRAREDKHRKILDKAE